MIRKCSIIISLLFFLALAGWDITTRAYAQDCQGDLKACIELLDDCADANCLSAIDCEKICKDKYGWVSLIKDKTFMSAIIGGTVLLIGGIAGIFLAPK